MAKAFKACSVDACKGNAHYSAKGARSLCCAHHKRLIKYGDPLSGHARNGEPKAWLETALKLDISACIEWPFGRGGAGYGMIKSGGKMVTVHTIACTSKHGERPSSKFEAAHSCGNRACCNPNHLRWATSKENNADKIMHGTLLRGENVHTSKLNERDVREIKRVLALGIPKTKIAGDYGVSAATIIAIADGRNWRHVRG
ncbi:hypothetical protein CO670_15540 [Rhizobium sp. J15]|uniref:HNH endonuclease n=1 Tax=Rhizobium sp. J15 TaxID=2035450 RepID=UPI000BE990E6|nr:HNH endonuclease [Rhizobium sp. J15]PDT15906.1 hypothetical protein CO670_15540 [Rhizobium sp. J15]